MIMIKTFVDWLESRGLPYERGTNWCDCVDYSVFINFWIGKKVHTFYALDNGAYKIDNVVVNNIEDIEGVLSWELEK